VAVPRVLKVIEEADAVILGPGSLYTSIIPNLLVKGIAQAIHQTKAPVFYVCNIMTQQGETDNFTVADHVKIINMYTEVPIIDYVVANSQEVSPRAADRYRKQGAYLVKLDEEELRKMGVSLVSDDLLDETNLIRHHSDKLARTLIKEIFRANNIVDRVKLINAILGQVVFNNK